jgi:uncharacterized protein
MTLVADSGALYALYDRDDRYHAGAVKTIKRNKGAIIIPTVILSEVDYLLREFLGIQAELDFIDAINSGIYTLEPFTSSDARRCRDLVASYRDLDIGLADAAVLATAERLGVRNIFTVDERDFRALKAAHGDLQILPADL